MCDQCSLIHCWLLHSDLLKRVSSETNGVKSNEEHKKEFFLEHPFTKIHCEVILWHKAFIEAITDQTRSLNLPVKRYCSVFAQRGSHIKCLYTLRKVQVQICPYTSFSPLSPGCLTAENISDETSLQKQNIFLFVFCVHTQTQKVVSKRLITINRI